MCTCGFRHTVTRTKVAGLKWNQTNIAFNKDIAVNNIQTIVYHAQVFTVGHNIYEFYKHLLSKSLPRDHMFRYYFKTMHKSYNKNSTIIVLIMIVP